MSSSPIDESGCYALFRAGVNSHDAFIIENHAACPKTVIGESFSRAPVPPIDAPQAGCRKQFIPDIQQRRSRGDCDTGLESVAGGVAGVQPGIGAWLHG